MKIDEVGYWSELKLEIIKKYAAAYSTILTAQTASLEHHYIDAFAGAGVHIAKRTGEFIPGSPLNALNVHPPFKHHHLIDLDGDRVENLRKIAAERPDCLITIDSPDFALRVAKKVRTAAPAIPIVHYVCPSVWAWRPGRAVAAQNHTSSAKNDSLPNAAMPMKMRSARPLSALHK